MRLKVDSNEVERLTKTLDDYILELYSEIKECTNENIQVKFVCFEELDYELYMNYLNGINKGVFEL